MAKLLNLQSELTWQRENMGEQKTVETPYLEIIFPLNMDISWY
jgi:hypothetical protein